MPPVRAYVSLRAAVALCLAVAAGALAGCSTGAEPLPADADDRPRVGETATDARGFVAYTAGDAPLVIAASHGGDLRPADLRDRTCAACVTVTDAHTREVALATADSFHARTGCRPHVVVAHLARVKLDANRPPGEGADGDAAALAAHTAYHAFLDTARARILRRGGAAGRSGLVADVHGHGHAIARAELGYLLDAPTLRSADLNAPALVAASSLRGLARRTGTPHEALVRGAGSLGATLTAHGLAAVPSAAVPAPLAGEPYFDGGYTTARHGSRDGGALDAVQVELPFAGARDTPAARAATAGRLARSLAAFLATHYRPALPASCRL